MRFPPEFIDRIRSHFLISEVVGKRVPLKRHGREFQACCPFHKEKSPSFTVNDEKNFYHCFGCGAHGDAIGFVKEYEGVSYPEAIERLAGEAGFALPQMDPRAQERAAQAKTLIDAMEAASAWFAAQLETQPAMMVRDYLTSRGIDRATIAQFRIGFAPADRGALRTHLLSKGFSENQLVEVGLLIPSDRGQPFARFTERLMFPITDRQGRVIAFGGRVLPGATGNMANAKYINSPDTPLFHKGQVLYNFSAARKAAKEANQIVVAEGYMDVIAFAQGGIAHAVAPLGTAMTEHHLKALWQTVPEPILCLDGDAAGQRAMLRAAELALPLMQAGQGLRFARLPQGQDPDSLLRAQGAEALRHVLNAAVPLSEALWNHQLAQAPESTPETRARLEKALMALAETAGDVSVRKHFRQYFLDQLRAASRPVQAKWVPGGKSGPFVSQNASAGVRALASAGDAQRSVQYGPRHQMLTLLCLAPTLLLEGDVEDDLQRLPLIEQEDMRLLQALSDAAHALESAGEAEQICAELPEPLREICAQWRMLATTLQPRSVLEAAQQGNRGFLKLPWRVAVLDCQIERLTSEYKQFGEAALTEENQSRMFELRQQLLAIHKERNDLQETIAAL